MKGNVLVAIFSIILFVLGGIGLYYHIPCSGWAIFVAVMAGISIVL